MSVRHVIIAALFLMTVNLAWGAAPVDVYEEHSLTYTGGDYKDEVFQYRLLKPVKIEAGKTYPVVLFLHGAGERGNDDKAQLKFFPTWMAEDKNREKYPCFVIAPQCRTGKKWADTDWSKKTGEPMTDKPSDQMQVALAALDSVIETQPVDKSRLYLTGLSMGGYGSWDLAARQPDRFAAVVPICGGGDPKQAAKLTKLPIWAWHGDKDPAVPVGRSREMIEAIKAAGGEPKYTELPGVSHDSWTAAYNGPDNVLGWLFEQKKK
ncbi:MAG: dienelactone hydrolase family protein [Pirellulales bacterium]